MPRSSTATTSPSIRNDLALIASALATIAG
jgi:hypothetical protein